MHRECIRAVELWQKEGPRHDCVFVSKDAALPGFRSLHACHVLLFFSFKVNKLKYPCALVTWFSPVGEELCDVTGMWIVKPDVDEHGQRVMSVLHIDCIV